MCGILGWYSESGQQPAEDSFKAALMTMRHRGPDDRGIYACGNVMFGHLRLSILDPDHGHQPWEDPETGVVVVYNGELYNFLEERELLESRGHRFRTDCDTEVLLKMYLEYGKKMLERLNGMFAFAIFDPRDKSLFLARDHVGIKPLYFVERDGAFFFASEIKALVSLLGHMEPDPCALLDYICLQYVMGEKTFFRGVSKLMPGEYLELYFGKGFRRSKYWQIDPNHTFPGTMDEAAEKLHELLEDSVRLQLRSDVPLGAHLSGGLDTGSICSLASRQLIPERIQTFTAGFNEGGIFDDTQAARISANHVGSEHHEIFPTCRDFADLYPGLLWHLDEPMAAQGVFPQYIVSQLARKYVTVVLGGQGADEIFAGYTRYYLLLLKLAELEDDALAGVKLGISREELEQSREQLKKYGPLMAKLQNEGNIPEDPVRMYWKTIDRSENLKLCLTEEFIDSCAGYSPYDTYREYFSEFPEVELLNRVLLFETSCWLPALLHIEDRMSMAVSLESRVPLLDPRIVEFAFSLPTRLKLEQGRTKAVMRKAFAAELAPRIRDRKDKLGFPVPTSRWFSGELKDFVCDNLTTKDSLTRGIFRKEALRSATEPHGDYDRSVWGMLNLELWHRNLKPETASLAAASGR